MSAAQQSSRSLHVVIAPDSYKGTFPAAEAAAAMRAGWLARRPNDAVRVIPQADGGEGTIDAIAAVRPDAIVRIAHDVTGPDGHLVSARWLELPDGTAVVELAESSGIALMPSLDPLLASTRGLGEMIAVAVREGAQRLVIGLGGSASTDGGAGALAALGAVLRDDRGAILPDGGGALAHLREVDTTALVEAPVGGVDLLCDTTAVLFGPEGAAHVFGPQKGAGPDQIEALDAALRRWEEVLAAALTSAANAPGAGAAGGTGFGLSAWGGRLVPGAARIASITGIDEALESADVLITGEGQYDDTSTTGKLVGDLVARALAKNTRTVVVAGRVAAAVHDDVSTIDLTELAGSTEGAMTDPGRWLAVAGARAADMMSRTL